MNIHDTKAVQTFFETVTAIAASGSAIDDQTLRELSSSQETLEDEINGCIQAINEASFCVAHFHYSSGNEVVTELEGIAQATRLLSRFAREAKSISEEISGFAKRKVATEPGIT
ncbi:MAG: hypothetical protein AAAFM81_11085 [Pseudomonadota bacterium]